MIKANWQFAAIVAALVLGPACLQTAAAQTGAPLSRERASFTIGLFANDQNSSTRLDSDSGNGTDIDLSDDLGLDKTNSVVRLGGYWWISKRQRLDFGYFDITRNSSLPIQKTIDFGDQTFTVNTVLSAESELQVFKADYTFAVVSRDRGYLGINAGLHVSQTTLALQGFGLSAEKQDLTAPLPVIGLRGDYNITPNITLRGALQLFSYSVDKVDGHFSDSYIAADYRFGKRFAVGLGYDDVTFDVNATADSGLSGSLNWNYSGWMLYFKTDFGLSGR